MESRIFSAIFSGKSFIDAAIATRKMKSFSDFVPEIMRSCKLSRREVDSCPLQPNETMIRETMKAIPDSDDDPVYGEVPDKISNELHVQLAKISLADLVRGHETMIIDGWRSASPEIKAEIYQRGVTFPVSILTRQISFLWSCFKLSTPSIDILTKDAFDLVSDTKLDAKVTEEMVEQAFPHDIFLSMQKSLNGFFEIAVLRRGQNVWIVGGRTDPKNRPFAYGKLVQFVALGRVNLVDQIGRMTRSNVADSIVEGQAESDRNLREKIRRLTGHDPDEYVDSFSKNFIPEEERRRSAERVAELAMFVMKLRLMMTAEKAPIDMVHSEVGRSVSHGGVQMPPGKEGGIRYAVISLTKEFEQASREHSASGEKLDKFGKKIVEKQIGGFLRRQHYGPGNSLEKFIYIAPFVNRFWVNTGIHVTRIVK